jgi:hypothetical protein
MTHSKACSGPAPRWTPRSTTKCARRRAEPGPVDTLDTLAGVALWLTLLHSTAGLSIGFAIGSLTL